MGGRPTEKVHCTYCVCWSVTSISYGYIRNSKRMGWVVLNTIEDWGGATKEIGANF